MYDLRSNRKQILLNTDVKQMRLAKRYAIPKDNPNCDLIKVLFKQYHC